MFHRYRLLWLLLLVSTVVLGSRSHGIAANKPELTREQKAEVRAVRKAFNAAGKNLDKQQKAVDQAVETGPHAAGPIVRVVAARFKGRLKKYEASVAKSVKRLGNERLITSAEEFLAGDEKLKKSRDALLQVAKMHESLHRTVEAGMSEPASEPASDASDATSAASAEAANETADDEEVPPLFAEVPMMELVALGIGAPGMSQREIDCVLWTNRYRAKHGLRLLWADPKLSDSARMHSKDMVEHDFRDHISPLPGKATFRDRGKIFDTRADAENIAEAPYSGEKIVEYWLDSPPHKQNIDHPKLRRIGVGLHNNVWTQVFGGIDSFEK